MTEKTGNKIACVTGATGMIGRRIVYNLLQQGYAVRALTRNKDLLLKRVEMYYGDIRDESLLISFLKQANLLFHCAAELNDEDMMWDVNVKGTENLLRLIPYSGITYYCHLSSAGVVGKTKFQIIDETLPCNPQNIYERTKWEAEKQVAKGVSGCCVVILRPTNVIDENEPGVLMLPIRGRLKDIVEIFVKGGECAHIIYADDVASAAVYFVPFQFRSPQCFFVSCDHEHMNTFAGIWKLYRNFENSGKFDECCQTIVHLPIAIPHIIRSIVRGASNRGNIIYSSKKLLNYGFAFPLGLHGAIKQVIEKRRTSAL